MSGNFRCFAVCELFSTRETPGQDNIPKWSRKWEHFTKEKLLGNYTGIVIFGPHQDYYLRIFLDKPIYNILYQSKKCVNPNYKTDKGRNTIVIFEEGEK